MSDSNARLYMDRETAEVLRDVTAVVNRLNSGCADDHMLWRRLADLAVGVIERKGYLLPPDGSTFKFMRNGRMYDEREDGEAV